jgi:putative intracellular protease/amidase
MIIGIPVYQDVDLLDVAGPYEMFNWMNVAGSAVDVHVIAATEQVTTRDGLTLTSHKRFKDVAPARRPVGPRSVRPVSPNFY